MSREWISAGGFENELRKENWPADEIGPVRIAPQDVFYKDAKLNTPIR